MYRVLSVITLLLVSFSLRASDLGAWEPYIPKVKTVAADVMAIGASPELQKIGVRIQKSLKENSEWAAEYMSKLKPGVPMPYHPNLGVSESEYSSFVAGIKNVQLVKVGDAELKFSIGGDIIKVSGLSGPSSNDLVIYDAKSDIVEIRGLKLSGHSNINQMDENSATGRWKGKQWKIQEFEDNSNFKSIKFAIGKMVDGGNIVIYLDINVAEDGKRARKSYFYVLNGV
ncbi:hypothetical protein N474_21125 [Pseudoalteromonas luteoviolacea CPMOR-2]|uniref:hypothetical protein n=1 Tax=Pseudoalteromonas luteoviolacea TaxID=43657 RepID=UPI0007B06C01|nr:hypothetical protein [Pseudoalteromonas luteoviolacea]KZN53214.1 hypothetical protein N474_21125 [Pseudoalteromonas luteoviolacea CPMOR-2]